MFKRLIYILPIILILMLGGCSSEETPPAEEGKILPEFIGYYERMSPMDIQTDIIDYLLLYENGTCEVDDQLGSWYVADGKLVLPAHEYVLDATVDGYNMYIESEDETWHFINRNEFELQAGLDEALLGSWCFFDGWIIMDYFSDGTGGQYGINPNDSMTYTYASYEDLVRMEFSDEAGNLYFQYLYWKYDSQRDALSMGETKEMLDDPYSAWDFFPEVTSDIEEGMYTYATDDFTGNPSAGIPDDSYYFSEAFEILPDNLVTKYVLGSEKPGTYRVYKNGLMTMFFEDGMMSNIYHDDGKALSLSDLSSDVAMLFVHEDYLKETEQLRDAVSGRWSAQEGFSLIIEPEGDLLITEDARIAGKFTVGDGYIIATDGEEQVIISYEITSDGLLIGIDDMMLQYSDSWIVFTAE